MDWNPAYSWLVLALLLSLAELTSGAMVLLALGIAAALTAAVTALGLSLPWQLLSMGIFAGVLVPLGVMVIRPRFSPKGVAYGTTGTGVSPTIFSIPARNSSISPSLVSLPSGKMHTTSPAAERRMPSEPPEN